MNMKRMRGRNHRPNAGGGGGFRNQQNGIPLNRNHVFDSSGPEMRLRGTAQQLHEKYIQLARDASSNGDRVTGEAYYQHAEHYFRIISAINQAQNPNGQPNGAQPGQQNGQGNGYNGNGQGDYQRRPDGFGEPADTMEPRQAEMRQAEPRQAEVRQDQRYQEPRFQEPRYQEPRYQEPRQQEPRAPEQRAQEQRQDRPNEPRRPEHRSEQRQEPRPYEPRPKPEFQRTERYRPENPIADAPIDISSALEAELAAATAEPAGMNEHPALALPAASLPPAPPPESRAIPIVTEAPPQPEAPRVPRPRGRPRLVRPEAAEKPATDK